jgi:hypothetical protein
VLQETGRWLGLISLGLWRRVKADPNRFGPWLPGLCNQCPSSEKSVLNRWLSMGCGKSCRVRGPTLKIEVMGRIRYPDTFVYKQDSIAAMVSTRVGEGWDGRAAVAGDVLATAESTSCRRLPTSTPM